MSKYRKHILIGVFAAMVLWFGGDWLLQSLLYEPLATCRERTGRLQREMLDQRRSREKARKAEKDLELFKLQSLPSNLEVARSQYQAWLLALVEHVAFTNPNVDSSEPVKRKRFHTLSFAFRGKGTLEQLTRFLFEFYSTDHLHQIRSLSIMPLQGSNLLELAINIDALVLLQAVSKDRLVSRRSTRLASAQLEEYQWVVQRNLFGLSNSSDPMNFAYLTAVNYVDGVPEAWFSIRNTDEILHLRPGDAIEVGQFKGTVREITDSDVVLESEGDRWLMTVGENLAQASALPGEY
jgi:hypothetical protein